MGKAIEILNRIYCYIFGFTLPQWRQGKTSLISVLKH